MASASAIAEGFKANLGAASLFGAANVSKNSYKILETSGASAAIIITWTRGSARPSAFGGFNRERSWLFNLRLYLRDTADPSALLDRTFTASESLMDALEADPTIQDTVQQINSIDINQTPGDAVVAGGQTWLYLPCNVDVTADW
jgi:hypothetical protein